MPSVGDDGAGTGGKKGMAQAVDAPAGEDGAGARGACVEIDEVVGKRPGADEVGRNGEQLAVGARKVEGKLPAEGIGIGVAD